MKETITLLKKLQEVGIPTIDSGYKEIQARMTAWVNTGEPETFSIAFARVDRRAEVVLPRRADRAASISLKALAA